jgi:hypothetical protein
MTESAAGATFVTRYSGYENADDPWRVLDQQEGEWNAMPARGDYITQSSTDQYTFPDGPDSAGTGSPPWLNSGPNSLGNGPNYDPGLEVGQRENSARRAPELYVAANSTDTAPQFDGDGFARSAVLRRWSPDDPSMSGLESEGILGRSRTTGSRVPLLPSWFE